MNIDTDIEKSFFRAFTLPNVRDRVLVMLDSPKRRRKFRSQLPHSALFNPKWILNIPPRTQDSSSIYQILEHKMHENKIAPEPCHIISLSNELDGTEIDLKEALDRVVARPESWGSIIICEPACLGYFEGETEGDRYILFRHPGASSQ